MQHEHTYRFKAKITLFPTDLGGRKKPVHSGYRPSFAFNSKKYYSGEISLIDNEILQPGESTRANIRLLPASTLRVLKPNDSFIISEGNKNIGTGIIEAILE